VPPVRVQTQVVESLEFASDETRAEDIDPAVKAAGWGVVDGPRILRECAITLGRLKGHGRRGKALSADYVLVYRNHKLAVVEAKPYQQQTAA
jgi:type I restriction enzyme, R subunit